jgi:hypothetical protein
MRVGLGGFPSESVLNGKPARTMYMVSLYYCVYSARIDISHLRGVHQILSPFSFWLFNDVRNRLCYRQDITTATMRACKNAISTNSIPAFRTGNFPPCSSKLSLPSIFRQLIESFVDGLDGNILQYGVPRF